MKRRNRIGFCGLALGSTIAYAWLGRLDAVNGLHPVGAFLGGMAGLFAAYAAAVHIVDRLPDRPALLAGILLTGLGFRVALLPAGLPPVLEAPGLARAVADDVSGRRVSFERFQLYDDDLWRYLWDGHVLAHGHNPWVEAPAAPGLDPLAAAEPTPATDFRGHWPDIRDNVNHPELPTVYPPLAAALFFVSHALAPGSVLVWKLLVLGLDLLAAGALAGALRARGGRSTSVLLYAWNPLVVKVYAGSGHFDALLLALLSLLAWALLRRRHALAALFWAAAVLAKLAPIVLLPLLVRRLGPRVVAAAVTVVALGLLAQHAAAGSAAASLAFATDWRFNAGTFGLLEAMASRLEEAGIVAGAEPALLARLAAGLAYLAVLARLVLRDDGSAEAFPRLAAAALGALVLLSPVVMPWYLTWVLPFAVLAGARTWAAVTGLSCLAFLVMVDGVERPFVLALEHGLIIAVLIFGGRAHASRPAPHAAVPGPGVPPPRALAGLRSGLPLLGRSGLA